MSPEQATLRDLYELVESVREDMNDGFRRMDERLTPVEHYITADKARKAAWSSFWGMSVKVFSIVMGIIGTAIAAAGLILNMVGRPLF